MRVFSETKSASSLSETELARMFELLSLEFLGVHREDFLRDLAEKESVMLLRAQGAQGMIVGFSTLMTLELPGANGPVRAVFSGDTTVLPQYRCSTGIGIEAVKYFLKTMQAFPGREIYYVLISKGWRTYRILPFFFKRFAPSYDAETSLEDTDIIDAFGRTKYPHSYEKGSGLIRFANEAQRLMPDTIDARPPAYEDEHVEFFIKKNPTYLSGTELVCVAKICFDNFTDAARRIARMQRRIE